MLRLLTISRVTAILLLLTPSLWADGGAQPLKECEVLARINNEVILACELGWEVDMMLGQRLGQLPPEQRASIPPEAVETARRQLLEQLLMSRLDMALFYADFRSNAPQADLNAIHKSLNKPFKEKEIPILLKRLGAKDKSELQQKLYALGTSLQEQRESYYRKMIARSWLTETVEFKKEVTHDQMLEYYHEHADEYAVSAGATWEELMVRFDRHPNKQAAYRKIAQLGNQAHAASVKTTPTQPAFVELARSESDGFTATKGGQHQRTTRGSLAAESVDEAIFTLPVGQMSPILEGPLGFHIVRVLEREEAGKVPFRDVQAKIKLKVRDDRFDDAVRARITNLKNEARVWTAFDSKPGDSRVASEKPPQNR